MILIQSYLHAATATDLHQVADVSCRLNACSNKRLYIVVIQFFQLHMRINENAIDSVTNDIKLSEYRLHR